MYLVYFAATEEKVSSHLTQTPNPQLPMTLYKVTRSCNFSGAKTVSVHTTLDDACSSMASLAGRMMFVDGFGLAESISEDGHTTNITLRCSGRFVSLSVIDFEP